MKTVLFDLDGTLLPMNNEEFLRLYFTAMNEKMEPLGFDPKELTGNIWKATERMMKNDGNATNCDVFWKGFADIYGDNVIKYIPDFDSFYANEFSAAKEGTTCSPHAAECVKAYMDKGYKVVLATNPLFPEVATRARCEWAGLDFDTFELVTTYENSRFCKPNLNYFRDILEDVEASPDECIMIGNDVREDMCAGELGMETILITDCMVHHEGEDLSGFKCMTLKELAESLK